MKIIHAFVLLTCILPAFILQAGEKPAAADATVPYAVVDLRGSVNPIMAAFIVDTISRANADKNAFIVIRMDTPGGLVDSMRDIIKAIMGSGIPVVVYAYPKGAQAASAGGFIMLAANIAAMAPGTEIGAMHPVSPALDFMQKDEKGDPKGTMEKKVLNDTVAYASSLAEKRGRNVRWAVDAVKNARSSTYREALRLGVIDLVADDMGDLLRQLNGRRVAMGVKTVTLDTTRVREVPYEMNARERFLNRFADPQIVFVLLIVAIIGIGLEIKSPGLIIPGVIGTGALILFLMAIRALPVNLVGLGLIILAVVLFILELKFTSYGLLTLGGLASFIFGSMILFDSPLPGGRIPLATILMTMSFILGFVFLVVRAVVRAHAGKVSTGIEGMIGEVGRALRDFEARGQIMVRGEIWNAVSEEPVAADEPVLVTRVEGLTLFVKKAKNGGEG